MIYVLEIQDRAYVKVGFTESENVALRIAQLQTGNPYKINPAVIVPGTLMQEQAIHAALTVAFGRMRIPTPPNEWYPGRNTFMKDFVAALAALGAEQALALAEKYNPAVKQPGHHADTSAYTPKRKWGSTPRMPAPRSCENLGARPAGGGA